MSPTERASAKSYAAKLRAGAFDDEFPQSGRYKVPELDTARADAYYPPFDNLGTTWVAPGEGSTWRELFIAFGARVLGGTRRRLTAPHRGIIRTLAEHTNLLLTGAPLPVYDRQRWESGNVE